MLAQVGANTLSTACVYTLLALGFGLIYSTARFFNFAHGAVYTIAPYTVFALGTRGGFWDIIIGTIVGVLSAVAVGCAIDVAAYQPLRRQSASPLVMLLASLGIFIAIQNVIALTFGDDTKTIDFPGNTSFTLFTARVTVVQVAIVATALVLVGATQFILKRTRIGWCIRAVGADPELARITGVDSRLVLLATVALGSALGAAAGILVAMDSAMSPTMGMNALMIAVVVVIVGGIGSLGGTAVAALLLAIAETSASLAFGSIWKQAAAFVLLAVVLVMKPQGLFGVRTSAG